LLFAFLSHYNEGNGNRSGQDCKIFSPHEA